MKIQRETPKWLADKMVNLLLNEAPQIESDKVTILEPSCGLGNIIEAIENHIVTPIIGVELNKDLSEKAKLRFEDNEYIKIINGDFLHIGLDLIRNNKIKNIIMLPPFKNMIFIEHILLVLEAWKTFKDDGLLISLVHNGFWIDNSSLCVKFRELITDDYWNEVTFIPIPDNTFIEKGKSVPCSIMVLKHIK